MDSQNNENQNQSSPVSSSPTQSSPSNNTVMAALSYIGPLVIVSYVASKDDPFVKFHIKQGVVVFGLEVIVWILGSMMWSLWMVVNILNLATLILSIIGIVNVVQGNKKELPIVGKYANSLNL